MDAGQMPLAPLCHIQFKGFPLSRIRFERVVRIEDRQHLQFSFDERNCGGQRFLLVAEALKPLHGGFAPEPGELALGVVAVTLLHCLDGRRKSQRSVKHSSGLAVAKRVEGFDGAVAIEQLTGLFDEAGGKHGGCALVEAVVKSFAWWIEADAQ